MDLRCLHCNDQALGEADLFCPNCGAPALCGRFAFGGWRPDPDGAAVHALHFHPFPTWRSLRGIDLVVLCDGDEVDRIAAEVLQAGADQQIALPGLQAFAAGDAARWVELASQTRGAPISPFRILRRAFSPLRPKLAVVGALSTAALVRQGGEATAWVRIRNDGGAAEVGPFMLELPQMGLRPTLDNLDKTKAKPIGAGEATSFEVAISGALGTRLLERINLGKGARLRGPDEINLPINLIDTKSQPLQLQIRSNSKSGLAEAGFALRGRRARIGAVLANRTGEAIQIHHIRLRPDLGEWMELTTIPSRWRRPIGPGRTVAAEMRPFMTETLETDGGPLREAAYEFDVQISGETVESHSPVLASGRLRLHVRSAAPFTGRVAIDFGTTETSVAASSQPLRGPQPPAEPPFIVELGPIGLSRLQVEQGELPDDEEAHGQRFISTTLGLNRDGQWSIGADLPTLDEAGPEDLLRFERFKWLADGAIPEAEILWSKRDILEAWANKARNITKRVDPKLLIEEFLVRVRELIEEHPDVGATCSTVDHPTGPPTIVATRPVFLSESMQRAYAQGFEAAQMPNVKAKEFGAEDTFILESWPPLLTATEPNPNIFRALTLNADPLRFRTLSSDDAVSHLVVFDVGGGSADFSVLEVTRSEGSTTIAERAKDMSIRFTGLRFEDTLRQALLDWFDKDEHWIERATGSEMADLNAMVRWLQYSDGPLGPLADRSYELFFNRTLINAQALEDEVRRLLGSNTTDLGVRQVQHAFSNKPVSEIFPIDFADFPALVAHLERRFDAEHWSEMEGTVERLRSKAGLSLGSAEQRLIISGRGAACPLADAMIRTLWQNFIDAGMRVNRLVPPDAKSITSWGAVRLVDLLGSGADIHFELPETMSDFRVHDGSDGSQIFTRKMDAKEIWAYRVDGKLRLATGAVEDIDSQPTTWSNGTAYPVERRTLALLRADNIRKSVRKHKLQVLSGPPGAYTEETPPAELNPAVAAERQWVFVIRNGADLMIGISEGSDQDAAIQSILEKVQ